jgi:thioredoxin-like negative regulator of GroEL
MDQAYDVRSVPTTFVMKDGTPISRNTGIMPKGQLEQFIKSHQ